ncbi:oocyte zinc finger protein XlCOF8.4-like isoform X2 [Boleophthalmus pectinirostris]|uniref:oocyte zinc finger protein XlCOF8.4-like isoform X2 n=1 Tax=Boleophthalmus pectinirostris TaxID=150288 RepID=UPI00242C9A4D|nr:oocyte zinc finger protein XlCOF8.4-like isoform X2 [Boleophthalmus pectinirostris]
MRRGRCSFDCVLNSYFALHAHTLLMENTRRNAHDAAFKLKAIDLAVKEGNRAAARALGINESMVRRWRRQRDELTRCKKTTKAFRGKKSRRLKLENVFEDVDTCGLYSGGQTPPLSPGPGLKQEPPETPKIKEEPEDWSIKQEEEQLQVTIPDYITVRVKTEEVEEDEETLGEDISSEAHLHSEAEGDMEHLSDNEVDWTAPLSCSTVQMDTEIDGNNQVQFMARTATAQNFSLYGPVAETSAAIYNGDIPGAAERLPTGERSYSCSICNKDFTNISGLIYHKRTHTGEKPYSCPMCNTRYTSSSNLKSHMRSHSGEKPYSCSICNSWFTSSSNLKRHMGSHSGEKPFGCSSCDKTFARKSHLEVHMRTHTGEKPFSCSVCNARFALNAHLKSHMRCHKENK